MLKLLLNKEAGLFLVSPETLPAISGVALLGGTCWNLRVVRPVLAQTLVKEGTTKFGSQKGKDKRKQRLT